MIFFDTETTGRPVRNCDDPGRQPRIVEIAAIKTDSNLVEIDRFETLINPGCPLPPEAAKWYDITDAMLAGVRTFPTVLIDQILPFWLGELTVVAYNVEFDLELMYWELRRIGWEFRFPYCSAQAKRWQLTAVAHAIAKGKVVDYPPPQPSADHEFCDVIDAIQYRGGKRIRLDDWSKEVYGDRYTKQTHRAMGDVERLLDCYRTLTI
jgi:DNA polymerase III epsilon subunit-like protein